MPRFTSMQNSFLSGEISPKLRGRTDIKEYSQGLNKMRNFVPYRSGGGSYRPGLRIDKTITGTVGNILEIPMVISETEAYSIQIKVDTLSGFAALDSTGTSVLGFISFSAQGLYSSIASLDINGFHWAQHKNLLVLTHNSGDASPLIVSYEKDAAGVVTVDFMLWTQEFLVGVGPFDTPAWSRIPMADANLDDTHTMTLSSSTSGVSTTLTSSSAFFTDEMIGDRLLVDNNSATPASIKDTIVKITATAGTVGAPSTTATVFVESTNSTTNTSASPLWYEASWSTSRGYPRTVTVFENRFIFGGNKIQPNTIWASEQYVFSQMNRFIKALTSDTAQYERSSVSPEDAFEFTIASTASDTITWLSATNALLIGTISSEYVATGGDSVLSRVNVSILPQSRHGSRSAQPAQAGNKTYFISRDGKSIIEMGFSNENGSFVAKDLSILSDEILHLDTADRSSRWAKLFWQESRSVLWALSTNGKLFGLTLNRASEAAAFHYHPVADTTFQSIMIKPNADGTFDDLHVLASRSDTGTTQWALKMVDDFEHADLFNTSTREEDKPVYMDFSEYLDAGSAQTVHAVNSNLEGLTVTILTEAGLIVTDTVTGGNITLAVASQEIIYGFTYEGILETQTPEVGPNRLLSSAGDTIRIDRVTAILYKTRAGQYGSDSDGTTTTYDLENVGANLSFTGKVRLDMPISPDMDNRVIIKNVKPLPLNVLGLVFRGQNNS